MASKGTWIEQIEKRTRNGKKRVDSADPRHFAVDVTIGSIHYWEDEQWKEIDNAFEPALAPWDWQMLKAGYHIRVKEDFTAGQIIEFEKQGETVQFQPMALEWTNDLDQIQQISMPQNVPCVVSKPEVDLLPAVGMPSHQGTIRWDDGYGEGLDFEWRCTSTRLIKILQVNSLNKLPTPEQYILDGGTPVLRLNLIFDPPKKQDVDIVVNGEVWDKKGKKQTFSVIEFRKDGEVLWGFMPLRYWGSGEGEENEGQSVATLEKRGNKLYISIRVPYEWLQSAVYPVFIDTPVEEQVEADADDDVVVYVIGSWSNTSIYFEAGGANFGFAVYYGGSARFTTVDIAQGSTINVAYLTLRANHSDSGTVVRSSLCCENADNPGQHGSYNDYNNAPRTAAVEWDSIPAWTLNSDYQSPSIVAPIQAIINRGGWSANNALIVFWEDRDSESDWANDARRLAYSHNGSATYAPKLHIEYEEAAAGVPQQAMHLMRMRRQ